jgi:DNA polymerase (family 10)
VAIHPRTASHVLSQIASYLELQGENPYKTRAYRTAARAVLSVDTDDLTPLARSGELAGVRGLGPATIAVIRDLVDQGESRLLERLRDSTPEGLLELIRVPGLSPERVHTFHEKLGVDSLDALEAAARDGRLAALPRLGAKTAAKILEGIAAFRRAGSLRLYHHAAADGDRLLAMVQSHPPVARAAIAGALRRRRETVGIVDIVAGCTEDPAAVCASFTRTGGVARAEPRGTAMSIRFVDGTQLDLHCIPDATFGLALFVATGSEEHVADVTRALADRGVSVRDGRLVTAAGVAVDVSEEDAVYRAAGLPPVPPELREGLGEVESAARGTLPIPLELGEIRGVLHCHTIYSDGKASVADMAAGAAARGWDYLGVSDHSEAAFYAGGLSRERVLVQHEEIDAFNAKGGPVRVLKGIEADILADGRLDYDPAWLSRFDYVIGSIHSRFKMDGAAMTERVLNALDQPALTVLAHPTGRLLLGREPYAIDLDAVFEKAAENGVAVELNCDPHRMDLDWRHLRRARDRGVTIAIGPDAHSVAALDNVAFGVEVARKAWVERPHVLNARGADEVLAFARRRRAAEAVGP